MAAPTENQFWRLRKDMTEDGRKLSVQQVIDGAQEYLDYSRNNPLIEIDYRGKDADKVEYPRMRAVTVQGLCHHLGIVKDTWDEWKKDSKYSDIIMRVEQLFYVYKFEGAAAGFLKENLIAREMNLAENKNISGTLSVEQIKGMTVE